MELDKSKLIRKEDLRVGDIIYYDWTGGIILKVNSYQKYDDEGSFFCNVISYAGDHELRPANTPNKRFGLDVREIYLLDRSSNEKLIK